MGRTLRAGEIPITVINCVHATECAGCPLIHLDYAQQLTSKRARVVAAMSHYPALELLYTKPVTPAEPMIGYRGRAKLIVSPEGRIGLYARSGNHDVVDIPNCRVLSPILADVAASVRDLIANPPSVAKALLQPYNPFGNGVLRALDLREVRYPAGTAADAGGPLTAPRGAYNMPEPKAGAAALVESLEARMAGPPSTRAPRRIVTSSSSSSSGPATRPPSSHGRPLNPADQKAGDQRLTPPPQSSTDRQTGPGDEAPASRRPAPVNLDTIPPSSRRAPDEVGVLVTFVLQRDRAPSREELREAAAALRPLLPRTLGIAVNFHDTDAPQILGPDTIPLDGLSRAQDRIGPTFHYATFGSFVQAHREQASRVHALIAKEIGAIDLEGPQERVAPERPKVLDLYGGSGAISIALAHANNAMTMVESFAPATANARSAADAQGLRGFEVKTGDVAEVVASFAAAEEHFDAVVMNPPRRGVSPAAREAIATLGAPLLVYVSCDPDTLARDLDHFGRLGYLASELIPFDMIPLTEEVETVCVLRRAPPTPPRILYEDDDVLVVDKGPHEPVTQDEGDYPVFLLQRCMRLPLPADTQLEPVHRVDAGTSGLCMLAKNERARVAWSAALQNNNSGRLIYLAAAKGVTPAKGAITRDLREGGRVYPARTRYRRLAIASGHSILRVIPDGGRTHQIRRHLAAIGHPVIGDERYGHLPTNRYFEEKHGLDRSFVHLIRIEVQHPRTGAKLIIESTLPGDLRAALERSTGNAVLRFLEQKHALGEARTSSIPPPPSEESRASSLFPDVAPSSRVPLFSGDVLPPSTRRPPSSESPGSKRISDRINITVPDLDESPRTLRHPIVSDDED